MSKDKEMYDDLFEDLRQYIGGFDPEELFKEAFDEDLWTEYEKET